MGGVSTVPSLGAWVPSHRTGTVEEKEIPSICDLVPQTLTPLRGTQDQVLGSVVPVTAMLRGLWGWIVTLDARRVGSM